ncbi:hypothetical protein EHQ53_05200 [Leptospira langatensis]|uniref:DUF5683 domain-containing protein n=1 Tax=Leptospira langatensis TaxID=2484983 RepID=A0A5F1ZVN0_9LEPT|nr:hypothetical protein [Leptospira langatensis]TGK02871.1 hypothetical protein EHO57_06035 [Leptospira langatensis]TGL41625.1 hypothetical protein EHQ53_05200 [Leptospira langatensis]
MAYRWLFIICLVCFTPNLFGSSLTLKNGKVLQGKVVNQTRTEVHLEVDGKVLTIPKTDIVELNLKDTPKLEPKKEPVKPKEEVKKEPEPETPTGPRWYNKPRWAYSLRSAVVPGWGIWKADRKYLAAGTFVLFAGAVYKALQTQQEFNAAHAAYKSGATNYFIFALNDPVLQLPANTGERLIGAFLVNKGAFNHYQHLAAEGNDYQYIVGLVYGLQLFYSYYLGVKAEREAALGEGPSSGFKFSFAPSYRPMNFGGNGMGWNGEVKYDFRF